MTTHYRKTTTHYSTRIPHNWRLLSLQLADLNFLNTGETIQLVQQLEHGALYFAVA